jgi:Fe-S-cluster containining protein
MPLTVDEIKIMGPNIVPVDPSTYGASSARHERMLRTRYRVPLSQSIGWFMVVGACYNLNDDGTCSVYESRPSACRDFAAGSEGCKDVRIEMSRKNAG